MVSTSQNEKVVMVVDDEEDVADTYELRLRGVFETRVAYGGEEALEKMEEAVDAMLLDRRMPDIHGDDVLEELREQGYDCVVVMLTAVDPDLNILEMDFDDYLCKPVQRETLITTLNQHLDQPTADGEDEKLTEFISLVAKLDVLDDELSHTERAESEEYQRAKARAKALGPVVQDQVDDLDELIETYRSIARGQ